MADTIMVPRHTITTGDVFIPEVWTKDVLLARESNLVLANLVERLDEDAAQGGDVLNIPQIANLSANAKLASTSVTLQAPTETDVNLSLNRHFEASILLEDRLLIQMLRVYRILQKYSAKAGYAVAKQMDTDLANLYSSATNNVGNGSTGLTDANLLRAVQYLDDADVPETDRHFVGKPTVKADLSALDKFTLFQNIGTTDPIRRQAFGEIYGAMTYWSTNLTVESATPNVVHNLLFHREAMALAVQLQPRVQFQYKQQYLGTLVTADSLWGQVVQRADHVVDVRTSE